MSALLFFVSMIWAGHAQIHGGQPPRLDELLVKAFSRLPVREPFIAQEIFLDENEFEVVLQPTSRNSKKAWSVTVSAEGKVVLKGEEHSPTRTPMVKAFECAASALARNGELRFPCRISWSGQSSGMMFSFESLPFTPGEFFAVRVSKDCKHAEIIPGE